MRIEVIPGHLHRAAVELWHDTGLTRPWNDPVADLRRAVASPSATVLAALDRRSAGDSAAAELVGTAMVGHDGHRGWVYYLAVRPGRQGRGTGRHLMLACEDWLTAHVPKVQLMVRSENTAAVGFYAALGYERSDVVVLARRLDRPPER